MNSFNSYNKRLKKNQSPLLLSPGPVILATPIKKSLSQDMWHHRSFLFKKALRKISSDLKILFQTKQDVLILACTGTGAMEASLSNILSPKEEVLCVSAGKFGERWKEIALAFNLKPIVIEVPWGQAVSIKEIEKHLNNKNIKALLITACETSTATEQPIKEVAKLLKNYPDILLVVDAITGLGAMELKMDKWGIDVMIAGSQKTFWLPAGLAFICLSQKAWKKNLSSKLPKYYFDLNKERQAQQKGETAFSSSVSLIRALSVSLKLLKKKGLKNLIIRTETLKKACHIFCKFLGLELFSSKPANSLTALKVFSADSIKKNLERKHGIFIAGGQGQLKNKILRIGHLGPLTNKDFIRALKALGFELVKQKPDLFTKTKIKMALKKVEDILKPS
ncbi:MAG: alanine--glyoxylate aminotransferase family protein [Bdellovibrionaceae bacterium]|nr:alanine--glyoxylate aminotransferase family protein [Pseudobdellovibrionaceae bacterium]